MNAARNSFKTSIDLRYGSEALSVKAKEMMGFEVL